LVPAIVKVGVSYLNNPKQVASILVKVGHRGMKEIVDVKGRHLVRQNRCPYLDKNKPSCGCDKDLHVDISQPVVRFNEFNDSSLDFTMWVYVRDYGAQFKTKTDLRMIMYEEFKRYDIRIPWPIRTIYQGDEKKEDEEIREKESEVKVFPDGESKITLKGKISRNKTIIVQSIYPPVDSNLIQALSLISKAKDHSNEVVVVVPYLGYSRQDREFLPGEIVTMKILGRLFKGAGASKIIVVDIHSKIGLKHFKIKSENISAISDLVKYFKKINLRNPLVVSPDQGGKERAKEFASEFDSEFIALKKQRDRKTGKVKIKTEGLDIVDRDVILVDDMISTGGSIIKATEFLKKQKCKRVFVACTHALLMNNAEKKIRKAGVAKIISTNTIPGKTSIVDISSTIAKALK
jgi:ribose-phosphate pyrophosphokinase